jgi:hypothetical protein
MTTVRLLPGAKCHGEDPELFYPDKGQSAIHARRICNGHDGAPACPVKADCLAEQMHALRHLRGHLARRAGQPGLDAERGLGKSRLGLA